MTVENSCLATVLDKKTIGRRFKEARQKAGLSQGDMARQLSYKSSSSIANKENGTTFPSVLDVHFLSFYSGFSIDWIINGRDKSFSGGHPFGTLEALTEDESDLIRQYRTMSDKVKARFAFASIRMKNEAEDDSMD